MRRLVVARTNWLDRYTRRRRGNDLTLPLQIENNVQSRHHALLENDDEERDLDKMTEMEEFENGARGKRYAQRVRQRTSVKIHNSKLGFNCHLVGCRVVAAVACKHYRLTRAPPV